ncbi:hypothetical protein BH11BAC4_BH11BAC4_16900 [soil metagenome]
MNFSSCAFKSISRTKNVTYQQATSSTKEQQLNVFAAKKSAVLKDVFIFIHGGNWNSGNKSLYSFLGSRLARKNVVAVIINYPLSPDAKYDEMALACAKAVQWTKENIKKYGGDSSRIFISGHSAGGHLAALISVDNTYFEKLNITNPIKGTILIDAAGLDMYDYLKKENFHEGHTYIKTFTNDSAQWRKSSPIYFLDKSDPPMLIYRGGKTYPSIIESNEKFILAIRKFAPGTPYYIQEYKKHVPMIFQYLNSYNVHYREIIDFMNATR